MNEQQAVQAPLAGIEISQEQMNLIKLFTAQVSTLPKFKASRGELWRSFETTFRIKWANSTLGQLQVNMQKRALLGAWKVKHQKLTPY